MKHQKQGRSECYLTCIAMLLDKPLATLKAEMGIGDPWKTYPFTKWDEVSALVGIDYTNDIRLIYISYVLHSPGADLPIDLFDLTGKGILILEVCKSITHAICYENGLIYDPAHTKSETWEAYQLRNPTYTLLTNTKVTIPANKDFETVQ